MGTVSLKGDSPFPLPDATDAGATASDGIVKMTVTGRTDDQQPVTFECRLPLAVASKLHAQLEVYLRFSGILNR